MLDKLRLLGADISDLASTSDDSNGEELPPLDYWSPLDEEDNEEEEENGYKTDESDDRGSVSEESDANKVRL